MYYVDSVHQFSSSFVFLPRIATDLNGWPYHTFKEPTLFHHSSHSHFILFYSIFFHFSFDNLLHRVLLFLLGSCVGFLLLLLLLLIVLFVGIFHFINIYILWYVHTVHKKYIRIYCRIKTIKTIEIQVDSKSDCIHVSHQREREREVGWSVECWRWCWEVAIFLFMGHLRAISVGIAIYTTWLRRYKWWQTIRLCAYMLQNDNVMCEFQWKYARILINREKK